MDAIATDQLRFKRALSANDLQLEITSFLVPTTDVTNFTRLMWFLFAGNHRYGNEDFENESLYPGIHKRPLEDYFAVRHRIKTRKPLHSLILTFLLFSGHRLSAISLRFFGYCKQLFQNTFQTNCGDVKWSGQIVSKLLVNNSAHGIFL